MDSIRNREPELNVHLGPKVMKMLDQAGIIQSQRGPGGGYRLIQGPDELSVYDVVDDLGIVDGRWRLRGRTSCNRIRRRRPSFGSTKRQQARNTRLAL